MNGHLWSANLIVAVSLQDTQGFWPNFMVSEDRQWDSFRDGILGTWWGSPELQRGPN